eukprot:1992416-Rhodomonas_salina.4
MGAKVEPVKQAAQSRKMQSKGGRQRGRMACTRACLIMASSALCLFAPCSCWSPASFALAFPQELHTPSSLCSASSLAKHVCNTQQRTALSSSSSSSNPNNIGVGVDTNHAKKSQAFDLAKEDVLAPCIILVRPFLDQVLLCCLCHVYLVRSPSLLRSELVLGVIDDDGMSRTLGRQRERCSTLGSGTYGLSILRSESKKIQMTAAWCDMTRHDKNNKRGEEGEEGRGWLGNGWG